MNIITKSRELKEAKIEFISLVKRAANKYKFLIQKSDDGSNTFITYGEILKADSENHYVTGIVYAPDEEDTQGDCMTADEIKKAAYWFMKNGKGVDLQHDFEKMDDAVVVESWIAKSDCEINGTAVKEGSWLVTIEINDPEVWSDIENGEITGFSMGGTGIYEEIKKNSVKKGFWKGMFEKFSNVKKGEVADEFSKKAKSALFWQSFETLRNTLCKYDSNVDENVMETDVEKIKTALNDFTEIVQSIMIEDDFVGILSASNPTNNEITKTDNNIVGMSEEDLKKFITDTVKELLQEEKNTKEETVSKADIEQLIEKAIEPICNARGIPSNFNYEGENVKKESDIFSRVAI